MLRSLLFLCLGAAFLRAQAVSDNFDGPVMNSAWTLTQQAGTVGLSSDQAVSPLQSLKFASTSTGQQRTLVAERRLAAPAKGLFTVYFYDSHPNTETLYMYFNLESSTVPGINARIGVDDYDAYCYQADVHSTTVGNQGPNTNCTGGISPDTNTTSVRRTAGWHRFDIDVKAASVVYKIDGNTVYTHAEDMSFDIIRLAVSGPSWRQNTIAYFDDFSYTPAVTYSVCPLYDASKAVKSGATIPIKIQICDGGGNNLSSSSLTVHATGLVRISSSTSEEIQDAGNSNPDYDFRYDATLGGTGGYIFNLKTTGLVSGTYRLSFTAGTVALTTDFIVK